MRLDCDVVVAHSANCSNLPCQRPTRAELFLGPSKGARDDLEAKLVELLVCTLKEKKGRRFVVTNNVDQMFERFVENGKLTVRLKQPPLEVLISRANAGKLTMFVRQLKAASRGQTLPKQSSLKENSARPLKLEQRKTKLVVKERRNYPFTAGFPTSLELLDLSSCQLARIDSRWLKLLHLRELRLVGNRLNLVGPAKFADNFRLSSLRGLRLLDLSDNGLDNSQLNSIVWAELPKGLTELNLAGNSLEFLPSLLLNLTQLVSLNVQNNRLSHLPYRLDKLAELRRFYCDGNRLTELPAPFCRLGKLDYVSLTRNADPLYDDVTHVMANVMVMSSHRYCNSNLPTCFELAAEVLLNDDRWRSLLSADEQWLPWCVSATLHSSGSFVECVVCGRRCSQRRLRKKALRRVDLTERAASHATADGGAGRYARVAAYCCSAACQLAFFGI